MATALQNDVLARRSAEAEGLVSVVIVCYNQAQYLGEAIESVLAQIYRPVEVIVVDDGSTDGTAEIAARYRSVRYLHQDNRGLAAARNAGLARSLGELITFLDADDRLLPHAIEAGVECFRGCPEAAFVFGRYINIRSDGSPAPTPFDEFVEREHYWHLLQGNFIGMHGAVLYRHAALTETGGFDESLRACEDYELYLRLARRLPVRGYREPVAEYRKHGSNMSRDHAFMLRSVLAVLSRERAQVSDGKYRQAIDTGIRVWREYYGNLLIESWKAAPDIRGLAKIVSLWPQGVLRRIPKLFRRRAVRWGSLRRVEPVSRQFGFDRGTPVDRHYIESFLAGHAGAIRGRVLEIGDQTYSKRFGGEQIIQQDVLHVEPGHPGVTMVADLADAPQLPSGVFDCIIFTQTLHYIFNVPAAVRTLSRMLKPGGTLLATLPGISQICRDQFDKEGDCWRFTATSARRLFSASFDPQNVKVRTFGNVLSAVALLEGLTVEDLSADELNHYDPDYQVTIAVAAAKS